MAAAEHLRAFARLPFVLEIDTARGPVGVLHADVPQGMDWSTFIAKVEALDEHTLQTCLWGRQRVQADRHEGVEGIGRVFVGHTPQWGSLNRYGNVYVVDTGAVFGQTGDKKDGALTLANMLCGTNALTAQRPLALLNIADTLQPPALPFGTGPGYTRMPDPSSWLEAWRNRA